LPPLSTAAQKTAPALQWRIQPLCVPEVRRHRVASRGQIPATATAARALTRSWTAHRLDAAVAVFSEEYGGTLLSGRSVGATGHFCKADGRVADSIRLTCCAVKNVVQRLISSPYCPFFSFLFLTSLLVVDF
jgi:hypothetical protein